MKVQKLLVPTAVLLMALWFLPTSSAAGVSITVVIGTASTGTTTLTGTDSVDLSQRNPYPGNVTIQSLDGSNPPSVTAGDDTQNDSLVLKNAKITTSTAMTSEYHIAFWGTFTNPPSTPGNVSYQITSTGSSVTRGGPTTAATYDTVRARGNIGIPLQSDGSAANWYQITNTDLSQTITSSSYLFFGNPSALTQPWLTSWPQLTGSRKVMGDFWFMLKNLQGRQDVLSVSSSPGIKVWGTTNMGEDGGTQCPDCPVCPDCTPRSQLSLFCATTHSTAQAYGCPSCVTEDGMLKPSAKATLFAKSNWDNLNQDMARGQGEHLTSLATLLNVPSEQQSIFFSLAQHQFRVQTQRGNLTPNTMLVALKESMASHPLLAKLAQQSVN